MSAAGEWAWCAHEQGEGVWEPGLTREEAKSRCVANGGGCIGLVLRGEAVVDALVDSLSADSVLRDWEEQAAGHWGDVSEDVFLGCELTGARSAFFAHLRPALVAFAKEWLNVPDWIVDVPVLSVDARGGES